MAARSDPFLLETSVPGIFVAGDVRHGSIKRVASSVGASSMAIAFVQQFLAERDVIPSERSESRNLESSRQRAGSTG